MHNLRINNGHEWIKLKKNGLKPDFIPSKPDVVYKDKGWVSWGDFLGDSYIKNNRSLGELAIDDYLVRNGFNFEIEKTFDTCYNKNFLRFDFYLLDFNVLIEFDGKQHYKPSSKFGGYDKFEQLKINDLIKNEWVINNGFKLIRIPYYQYKKIDKILNELLPSRNSN